MTIHTMCNQVYAQDKFFPSKALYIPTSGDLYISLSYRGERIEAQKFPLEIVDIIGNKVLNSSIENGSLRLDVGNLQPGHYKIIINTGREIITSSFIVNK